MQGILESFTEFYHNTLSPVEPFYAFKYECNIIDIECERIIGYTGAKRRERNQGAVRTPVRRLH